MICPNCGTRYDDSNTFCPGCGDIRKEVEYQPVKKVRKKGSIVLTILILLLLLCVGAAGAYYSYLKIVEKKCREMTAIAMDCAIKMDFTELDEQIPEQWKEKTDIKGYMTSQLEESIKQTELGNLLDRFGITPDYDSFFQLLAKKADYTIDNVSTSYNQCKVTITTSNLIYPQLIENLKDELNSLQKESASDGNWWSQITGWFSDLFHGEEDEETLPNSFSGWIDRLTENQEVNEVTGCIIYGIKDGHWTLLSVDEDLFYNLYGFPNSKE